MRIKSSKAIKIVFVSTFHLISSHLIPKSSQIGISFRATKSRGLRGHAGSGALARIRALSFFQKQPSTPLSISILSTRPFVCTFFVRFLFISPFTRIYLCPLSFQCPCPSSTIIRPPLMRTKTNFHRLDALSTLYWQ